LTEAEFWELTPYEFSLLMRRHRAEVLWMESMAATPAWILAEVHRNERKRRKAWTLDDWTISGMRRAYLREQKKRREAKAKPAALWSRIGDVMRQLGGK
jgi:hypothetical protein